MLGIEYGEVRLPDKRPQAELCSSICMCVFADQRMHRHRKAQTNLSIYSICKHIHLDSLLDRKYIPITSLIYTSDGAKEQNSPSAVHHCAFAFEKRSRYLFIVSG